MAKKAAKVETTRKLEKLDGKAKVTVGKYYQIGETHSLKADKKYLIETKEEVTEHDGIDTFPVELKARQVKKDKKK